ncbi:MAG: choice-of-anchor B family protein, partial [Gemmatimonadota bacterium]
PGLTGQPRPCSGGTVGPFPCNGITLLSYLPIAALGGAPGVDLNDIWGWTDQLTGSEYALVGRRDGIAFVDITNATDPRFLGFLPITPGATANFWHDVKVYSDHAYIVADGAGAHGMQVFDLHELRGVAVPKQFAPVMVYTGVRSAHNMVINEATGFGFIVGANGGGNTCGGGLHMVNLQVPTAPVFAGCFSDDQTGRSGTGYTHDAQCVTYIGPDAAYAGHEICFGSNETALSIADVTNKAVPVALSRASYPAVSYTHQGWLTPNQRYLYVNDELDELNGLVSNTRTLIWDVADLDDPVLVGQFLGPTSASDHNNYIRGTTMFASNYQYGVRVINLAEPLSPVQIGYIDTSPQRPNLPGFEGSWSNYPFFPSGNVVITSGEEGFFVIRVP